MGDLNKPSATSNLEVSALKHPPKMTLVAAPALNFCPARTALRYGLIAKVTGGPGASSGACIKLIARSLYSLCFAWESRATEKPGGQEDAAVGCVIGLTNTHTKRRTAMSPITENN